MISAIEEGNKKFGDEEIETINNLKDDLVLFLLRRLGDYYCDTPSDDDRKVNVLGSPGYNRSKTKTSLIVIPSSKGDAWSDTMEETPYNPKQTIDDIDSEVQKIVNVDVLNSDYHIEFGDVNAPEFPDYTILYQSKNICYYYQFLKSLDHDNYVGIPQEGSEHGPAIISVQKNKKSTQKAPLKLMIRTSQAYKRMLVTCDGNVIKPESLKKEFSFLEDMVLVKIKKETLKNDLAENEVAEMGLYHNFKFGVLYVKENQDEDEIFNNREGSPDFEEFLQVLGDKIVLKNHTKYSGGLDTKRDFTGTHSIFVTYKQYEIMYHVSTLLPFKEGDSQQLERKRHIGNDIVVIIFKEGNQPFDPRIINSQFNHIFVIVQKEKSDNNETKYRIVIVTKPLVPSSTPVLPNPAIFTKNQAFKDFLLTKCINLERVALNSKAFHSVVGRNRKKISR